ncbi:GerAB/ArcD/ProY family transporter [Cohnella candidum]|uniref:Uncharacterized protein n=1 Tax=Cohnella candidum TaxID=2674991 RepID=A0A3G3JVJ0_9BACL|nr:GerAB/ArcD/ProY family transporter [Cohnella candidum]AYQ72252.1 hypothetical protein EAV92_06525 [Cohnella candidum]
MSRYFFYLFLMCMFINTIFFVPRLLMNERFDGAIMSVILAVIIGSTSAILFTKAMRKFPGEGLPEITARMLPGFLRIPLLLFLGVMWAIAGAVILISFSMITLRFLNPEANATVLLLCYCTVGAWSARFRPVAILNLAEFIIVLNSPFVLYIMFKTLSSPWFDWDSVKILSDYVLHPPTWTAVAAASYPFTGYINMALYNRAFNQTRLKGLWLIPIIGVSILFVSFVVPIGLLGIDSSGDYLYTWITAADTLRMQYGFIERVVYLFLFIYIGFSLLFVTVTWNVGALLIRDCFKRRNLTIKKVKVPLATIICVSFAAATLIAGIYLDDKSLIGFVAHWQILRLASETFLVLLVVWLSWRNKYA